MPITSSFPALLAKYRKTSFSEKDNGERFERLMQAYLKTDPKYAYRFKNVWLWTELKKVYPELDQFDLIICDEAHRTTGVTLSGDDESAFTKVHDNKFIKAKKRYA
jgi:predicted helicase